MKLIISSKTQEYLGRLPPKERQKIDACLKALALGAWDKIEIKHLGTDIKELKVRMHRLIFVLVQDGNVAYVVSAFKKQTRKTPLREIEKAEATLRHFIKIL